MTHLNKSGKKLPHNWSFTALGTNWNIETDQELAASVRQLVDERIETYDKTYSRFRNDSLVYQLRTPGSYSFPKDVVPLLGLYKELYGLTNGRMTPLIGNMLEQAGYDADYSLRPKDVLSDVPPLDVLGWDEATTLEPSEPVVLDVGAAGKGYLVDIIAQILEDHGVHDYTIDASGDIKQHGQPVVIGLEHPLDASKVIGTVELHNQSLCASATNRRTWGGLHHVFNPITKQPTGTMLATWVIAETTLLADALATALFFVPASQLHEKYAFTHVTIDANGAIDVSPDFSGQLYT